MTRPKRTSNDSRGGRRRRISVRAIRREVIDVRKLGRAIVIRAMAEAAAEAEAQKLSKAARADSGDDVDQPPHPETTDD